MTNVLVKLRVKDFDDWKSVFEKGGDLRKKYGETGHRIFVDAGDEKQVSILFEYKSADGAREFFASDELKQRMKEAGVINVKGIQYLDERVV